MIQTAQITDYETAGGISIRRQRENIAYDSAIERMVAALDSRRGAVLSSNYEYPGRYTRWDTGIIDPPLCITAHGRRMTFEALNNRGEIVLAAIFPVVEALEPVTVTSHTATRLGLDIARTDGSFTEEERSRIPSVFTVLRAIVKLFFSSEDDNLGLFGAFGYDLAFQFEPVELTIPRPADQRDLVLYLPDSILVVDHHAAQAWIDRYDFTCGDTSTTGLPRETAAEPFRRSDTTPPRGDHQHGEYARGVAAAKEKFKRGDLFEVVPGQTFYAPCTTSPAAIAKTLKQMNPSPYSFFFNLGEQEYLVGASPEMFVRVSGRRVETCPISGTIKRGEDAIADSEQILKLLNSKKDESELTMCSDVDRNDKSRICEPGSVRVIGRRQIEMYSRLIHTVDHIEGRLREGMDAFDAFLSHAWAVTVTGAPKLWAMRFIENHEKSPRNWYGGAVGMMHFNGNMNTGLTLRTIRIKDGVAAVRAGATLLYDSDPQEEEAETELKASAMLTAIATSGADVPPTNTAQTSQAGAGRHILLVDHEDSFVHTLANYFRQTGAYVTTLRSPVAEETFDSLKPDLVVLSPGPGSPQDFDCTATITKARRRNIPVFGVCLGLQALVEAYGGTLKQLERPMHGKPSRIRIIKAGTVFAGLPQEVTVGRYHSLFTDRDHLPETLTITAESEDGVIMAVEHKSEPVAAVQFHPESIMTLGGNAGMRMLENVVKRLTNRQ
ncbi:MAG: Anthranilate synthase [Candidatus Tokpelaia hoelldobleri]|uniref:Anthranilate synthase n=1 Tax=Candidatus Tokpelaia hoelldobleri TaxID=1902579 RepID=A0A1U9JTJ5_9HYPH|nr:MAG: Anthranilate synthase [Candidatus Tokpelaia hoelldoblerii]